MAAKKQVQKTETSRLDAALLAAQKEIKSIAKDARNDFSKYDYTSAESLIREGRSVLNKHGLYLTRASLAITDVSGSGDGASCMTHSCFHLTHPESGEYQQETSDFPALARKGTPLDKAVAAAATTALGYYYRDLLQLNRGEDIDGLDSAPQPAKADGSKVAAARRPPATFKDDSFCKAELIKYMMAQGYLEKDWVKNEVLVGQVKAIKDECCGKPMDRMPQIVEVEIEKGFSNDKQASGAS